jgi:hypothetical protein
MPCIMPCIMGSKLLCAKVDEFHAVWSVCIILYLCHFDASFLVDGPNDMFKTCLKLFAFQEFSQSICRLALSLPKFGHEFGLWSPSESFGVLRSLVHGVRFLHSVTLSKQLTWVMDKQINRSKYMDSWRFAALTAAGPLMEPRLWQTIQPFHDSQADH